MNRLLPKIIFIISGVLILLSSCQTQKSNIEPGFSFAFITDIHLQEGRNAVDGFRKAMDKLNELNPDFVITGGDLIMDALGQSYGKADSLYQLYQKEVVKLQMPVYNTMGNHEIYGIYSKSGADPLNPEYGEKILEKLLGESYYSFVQKGWKYMVLNSIEDTGRSKYIGIIDEKQQDWIQHELENTSKEMPIVISTHIPFITAFKQKYAGTTLPNDSGLVVVNGKEIIDMFNDYNLKLVLQGHLHTVEDVFIDGIHFITGGAVSGKWWLGPNRGYEEGFVMVDVQPRESSFNWEYIDYEWEVE